MEKANPIANAKRRYLENRDSIRAYQREYSAANRDRILAKVHCPCGSIHAYRETAAHKKTKKHQVYLAASGLCGSEGKIAITEDHTKDRYEVRLQREGVEVGDMVRRFPFGQSKEQARKQAEGHRQGLLMKYAELLSKGRAKAVSVEG